MLYSAQEDPYCYANTDILINLFNIKNKENLLSLESDLTSLAEIEIHQNPVKGNFDLPHLQTVHQRLFSAVYAWAGELRTIRIAKDSSMFAFPENIKSSADSLFLQLKKESFLRCLPDEMFAKRLAYYMGELNAIHPFREGNGRASRIFFGQLAENAGYELQFYAADAKEMLLASIASFNGDNSALESIIADILSDAQ